MRMNDPLGNALQAAGEARQTGRTRVIGALSRGQTYDARVAQIDATQEIRKHRNRALAGARAVIANETASLFGTMNSSINSDPGYEHNLAIRIEALTKPLETEGEATTAYDRLLKRAEVGDNVKLAGGIAAKAFREGWDGILGHWVTTPQLGRQRGGWGAVQRIRDAQKLLAGDDLPTLLQDLPSVEDIAKSIERLV